jgi:hypothetical protein
MPLPLVLLAAAAPSTVRVMLLPHSHEDPGWTQTIDEYYHGYDANHYGVKAIYDSVVSELATHKHRRFISVEMLFFNRWWTDKNTSDAQRATWRALLARGQVEFATAGWVMHDEIASMWDADINQMAYGHRWVAETFGPEHLPKHAWHIDEQGHVGATATLLARMGFETLTPNRISEALKDELQASRRLGFVWEGLPDRHLVERTRRATPAAAEWTAQPSSIPTQLLDYFGYCCPNVVPRKK